MSIVGVFQLFFLPLGKVNSPRRVVSSPRKLPQSPRGARRGGLAPTSLANFFKPTSNKQLPNAAKTEPTGKYTFNVSVFLLIGCLIVSIELFILYPSFLSIASSKKAIKENEAAIKNKDLTVKSPSASTPNEEQSKKMATSLILFEEVDVIFDDDSGFLAAIKTFMTTTKRPVILTTSGE